MKYFHHVLNGTKERAGVPQFQIYQKLNPSQSQLDAAIVLASQQGFIKINALSIVRKGILENLQQTFDWAWTEDLNEASLLSKEVAGYVTLCSTVPQGLAWYSREIATTVALSQPFQSQQPAHK
ncbi:MAG: hypothetical protein WBB28_03775 [Crinalium sp.]